MAKTKQQIIDELVDENNSLRDKVDEITYERDELLKLKELVDKFKHDLGWI